jgi:mannose-6-phosphate isomerase-like protein (cupin superfamily)
MTYTHTKEEAIAHKEVFGVDLAVYPSFGSCEVVVAETETGHNQEFYHRTSTFNYLILDGEGSFFLNDEEVLVSKGDMLSILPGTRIYYKGTMRFVLVTNPPWRKEDEVETKARIW